METLCCFLQRSVKNKDVDVVTSTQYDDNIIKSLIS